MKYLQRFGPLAVLLLIGIATLASGAWRLLSLETLKAHQVALHAYVAEHLILSLLAFIAVYALVAAASLPGALVLTLTGGFLFGMWLGSAATVVGATIGAVLLYGVIHTSLGVMVRAKAEASGGRLKAVIDGIHESAFGYILTLRLVPIAPFWLVNVAAALADAPLKAYTAATFIGIIPATVIYSSIGSGIGKVIAHGDTPKLDMIFEPFVFGPLAALALLSLGTTLYQRRRKSAA